MSTVRMINVFTPFGIPFAMNTMTSDSKAIVGKAFYPMVRD